MSNNNKYGDLLIATIGTSISSIHAIFDIIDDVSYKMAYAAACRKVFDEFQEHAIKEINKLTIDKENENRT